MEILGNIYGNGSRHVTRRVKLIETLNWESLFIPSWLSSCRSTNSHVGVNPHGSAEKVKLLLNSSHLEPLPGAPNVKVVLRHFHRCRYWSSTAVFLLLEGLRSLWSWSSGNTVDMKIYVVRAAGA
jgi:hypothetical protein